MAAEAVAANDFALGRLSDGFDARTRSTVRGPGFRQQALVAHEPAAFGSRTPARRDARGLWAAECEGGRAEFLSTDQQGSAGGALEKRGRVGHFAARRAATPLGVHDDQAI